MQLLKASVRCDALARPIAVIVSMSVLRSGEGPASPLLYGCSSTLSPAKFAGPEPASSRTCRDVRRRGHSHVQEQRALCSRGKLGDAYLLLCQHEKQETPKTLETLWQAGVRGLEESTPR